MLLAGRATYRINDTSELEHFMQASGGARHFDIADGGAGLYAGINIAELPDVTLVNVGANIANSVSYEPVDFVRHCYLAHGSASGTVAQKQFKGHSRDPYSNYGIVVPSGEPWKVSYGSQFESLVLRIRQKAIERILQQMMGSHLPRPVQFEQTSIENIVRLTMLRNMIFQFASEIDSSTFGFSSVGMAELEHALIVRFLLCNRHNYSHLLLQDEPAIGTSQLRRVEDYILTNWDKQLDTATLATVAGSSARTLFRVFQKKHGCSPFAFVKRIRLEKARLMLLDGDGNASVMAIALRCGFQSLGHFARSYQARFGELPSQTLRQKRLDSNALN